VKKAQLVDRQAGRQVSYVIDKVDDTRTSVYVSSDDASTLNACLLIIRKWKLSHHDN